MHGAIECAKKVPPPGLEPESRVRAEYPNQLDYGGIEGALKSSVIKVINKNLSEYALVKPCDEACVASNHRR